MTAPAATRRRAGARRRGIVYGYRTLRPEDNYQSVELGYVGQTRQVLRARDGQHREVQPFSDIIVGDPFVLAEGLWTDGELDAAERAAIVQLRPRYNIEHNRANPGRIPPWIARRQRAARDAARGVPAWSPPVAASAVRSWWPCRVWQLWVLAWLLGWPGWAWLLHGWGVPGWPSVAVGAAVSAGLLGWGVRSGRPRRRRRRRRR